MKHISILNIESLEYVSVTMLLDGKYIVLLSGTDASGQELFGILEYWDTYDQAMICAFGVAKMFNLPKYKVYTNITHHP